MLHFLQKHLNINKHIQNEGCVKIKVLKEYLNTGFRNEFTSTIPMSQHQFIMDRFKAGHLKWSPVFTFYSSSLCVLFKSVSRCLVISAQSSS